MIHTQSILDFLKTTLSGGVFVLLPLLLFCMLAMQVFQVLIVLATPIADLFPMGIFDNLSYPGLVASLLLLGASFVTGLAMKSSVASSVGRALEGATLAKLPLYAVLKKLTSTIADTNEGESFKPAVLANADGTTELAYLIEDHGDGQATVLLPWSPTALAGSLRVVQRNQVHLLNTTLGEFTQVLSNWGVGTKEMLGKVSKM